MLTKICQYMFTKLKGELMKKCALTAVVMVFGAMVMFTGCQKKDSAAKAKPATEHNQNDGHDHSSHGKDDGHGH